MAITLIGSLTACGTGKKDETKAGQETKATQEVKAESKEEISTAEAEAAASDGQAEGMVPDYLEFFSGSQGGSWYQVGSQLAALAQEATGVTSKVAAGGGSANPDTLQNGEGYFGLVYSGVGYQAYLGEGDYTESMII